ncbi:MAG: hypothetical protein ACLFQJ_03735 [Campylobacterales bacterium]
MTQILRRAEMINTSISIGDVEFLALKMELNSLERKYQKLVQQKVEYLSDIDEFNIQYNLHIGVMMENILNLKKEIFYKKTKYQENIKDRQTQEQETFEDVKASIDELKKTVSRFKKALEALGKHDEICGVYKELQEGIERLEEELLSHERKSDSTIEQLDDERELKMLYRRAAKLCHPDIIVNGSKEKAHRIMQELNDAYSKKDIERVREILLHLENGIIFESSSSWIDDIELLKAKIKEYRAFIQNLQNEIDEIKASDIFILISKLNNQDRYFKDLRDELEREQMELEKEMEEIF